MAQKRPLNVCDACQKQWYPRGQDRADKCARCGSSSVRIASAQESIAASNRTPSSGPALEITPSVSTPVVVPVEAAHTAEAVSSGSRSGSGMRTVALWLVLCGLAYFGWQYWQEQQQAAPAARSLSAP